MNKIPVLLGWAVSRFGAALRLALPLAPLLASLSLGSCCAPVGFALAPLGGCPLPHPFPPAPLPLRGRGV